MTTRSKKRPDVYHRITDKIIAALETGVRPWAKPWSAEHMAGRITRPLRHNGQPYQGINILMLWSAAADSGFAAPIWMTYRQAAALHGQVRRGETGEPVVYTNTLTRTDVDQDTGEESETSVPFMKAYTVFNVEQIDGLPDHYYGLAEPRLDNAERLIHAERFFTATGADIQHGGNRAYYAMHRDHIQLPVFEAFRDPDSYYATLAHESIHWTRHPGRLNRDLGCKAFGDAGYAIEELVAELGSAFIASDLELTLEPREDHASYIANWLKVLKNDQRALFRAAAHAQRAADFLHRLTEGQL